MLLQQTGTFTVVGEAEDGESAVQQILELKPEVVMMDLEMPKMGGVEATAILKKQLPEAKVLVFTSIDDDASIFAALKAGADGYCLKTISGEMLAIAIQSVLSGAAWLDPGIANKVLRAQASPQVEDKPNLSDSKLKLLKLIEESKSIDEIAAEFNVTDALAKGLLSELLLQLRGRSDEIDSSTANKIQLGTSIRPGDTVVGHYRIDEKIDEGGMGCVYRATHVLLDRRVAIKTLHEYAVSGELDRERFRTEAKAMAALIHPNLVTIFDYGLLNDTVPYLVMEYIDGKSLANLLISGEHLSTESIISIFAQVCDALQAVHNSGIVHRDLKPSNIMLIKRDDDSYTVKLVDFGIAKILTGSSVQLTGTGETIGTPLFMSPEQCKGAAVNHRSDLYSLGCTMYTAFTGTPPFVGSSAVETYMMHVSRAPEIEPLKACRVPRKIISLVLSLMEKSPEKRPASATEVRQALLKA